MSIFTWAGKVLASKDDAQEIGAYHKTFKCYASSATTTTMTLSTGTEPFKCIGPPTAGKEVEEGGTAPATTPFLNGKTLNTKTEAKYSLPAELQTLLGEAGMKVTKVILRWNFKESREKGKIGFKGVKEKLFTTNNTESQKWEKFEYTKAESEELTKANVEAITGFIEKATGTAIFEVYDTYLEVTVEVPTKVSLTTTTSKLEGPNSEAAAIVRWAARFTNVEIPVGAIILSAILKVWITAGTEIKCDIATSAADSAPEFKAEAGNLQLAEAWVTKFEALQTEWKTSSITTGAYNSSPNFKAILKQTIARAGWKSGNALAVRLEGLAGDNFTLENYDGTPAHAAELVVEYEVVETARPPAMLV